MKADWFKWLCVLTTDSHRATFWVYFLLSLFYLRQNFNLSELYLTLRPLSLIQLLIIKGASRTWNNKLVRKFSPKYFKTIIINKTKESIFINTCNCIYKTNFHILIILTHSATHKRKEFMFLNIRTKQRRPTGSLTWKPETA